MGKLVKIVEENGQKVPKYEVVYSTQAGVRKVSRFSATKTNRGYILGKIEFGGEIKVENFGETQTAEEACQKLYVEAEKYAGKLARRHKARLEKP